MLFVARAKQDAAERLRAMSDLIADPRFLQVVVVVLSMGLAGLARR
jgi:hypothetical protein